MDLLVTIDRALAVPLYQQVYDGIRAAILDGRLPQGGRLPSRRELADRLGVARFTVEDAYARLVAEGYVAGRHGSGTFVSATVLRGGEVDLARHPESDGPDPPWRPSAWAERLERVEASAGRSDGEPGYTYGPEHEAFDFDFRHGLPALDEAPLAAWRRVLAREAAALPVAAHHYGEAGDRAGTPALRTAIAAYVARSRALPCHPDQVIVTSSTRQGLDILLRHAVEPGQAVAVEDPGYAAVRQAAAVHGAVVRPVPVDADGLRFDDLLDRAGDAALLFVTPAHQFPTGGVLSLGRRIELLGWAARGRVLIVEDDYDAEFRYGERPLPALAGMAAGMGNHQVVYAGTLSKTLFPALRMGYLVVPKPVVGSLSAARAAIDREPPMITQMALATFIAGGQFERHLTRMRRLYARRRAALVSALATHFGARARRFLPGTAAGLHLLVEIDLPIAEGDLLARAAAARIRLDGASPCFSHPPARPTLLLGYAGQPEDRIDAGIACLARVLGVTSR